MSVFPAPSISPPSLDRPPLYALVGNPNCGKTTVFNALTGLRQKVGNYPGVTVEKKEGRLRLSDGGAASLIDLPGLYSLTPRSPDEAIARDVLLGHRADVRQPDGILHVVSASTLERNLYLTSQILELGLPTVIVLTMTDVAAAEGQKVDARTLEKTLGVPVVVVIAAEKRGLDALKTAIALLPKTPPPPKRDWAMPIEAEEEVAELSQMLRDKHGTRDAQSVAEATGLLMQDEPRPEERARWSAPVWAHIAADKAEFVRLGIDFPNVLIEARYEWVRKVCAAAVRKPRRAPQTLTDKIDKIVMHPFWGYVIFLVVMTLVFQVVFPLAQYPMDWIATGISKLGDFVTAHLPPGDLQDVLVNGVIAGVGVTVTFLPQILLLFFFLALLEDTGYMARAAFLMDKIMSKVGLHGKSFIPMLSSFGCAIPGIMATRTIDDKKSRLVTILVAPLMSCSARIPVYTLMIAAFFPRHQGFVMMAMYLLGVVAAFCMAWLFKKTLLKGAPPLFFLEMPPYHAPNAKTVLMTMIERAGLFLRRAGTVILSVSIVLWFLTTYPKMPPSPAKTPSSIEQMPTSTAKMPSFTAETRASHGKTGASTDKTQASIGETAGQRQAEHSYAGRAGKLIEPLIAPLGFDWRIGVSLVSSFVAREVFVSSMGVVYGVGDKNSDTDSVQPKLSDKLKADPKFSPLLAICIMIYYVLAMQCLSTIAVVKRETNGWKWPLFMIGYMSALAWIVTFVVWQVGTHFGWGV